MRTFQLLLWAVIALLQQHAFADEVRPAYLEIQAAPDQKSYQITWKQPVVENRRLPIDPIFPAGCDLQETQAPAVNNSALVRRWHTTCDLTGADVTIQGLSASITDVLVRFISGDGTLRHFVLRPNAPTANLADTNGGTLDYLWIGFVHLVGGIDHVLFVICLVLYIRQPWPLLKTITAFTLAHSVTLALSVLDLLTLPQAPVEAIIALSIVFLARELAQPEDKRSALTQQDPWIMAMVFGLLHGLGFARALNEIGLPSESLFLSLLLFNLGIELGQIVVILIFTLLLYFWRWLSESVQAPEQTVYQGAAYAMGCIATFWTIDRLILL